MNRPFVLIPLIQGRGSQVFALVVLSMGAVFFTATAHAHEPIFGIGPHTIHKYGIGLETEFEGGGDDQAVG